MLCIFLLILTVRGKEYEGVSKTEVVEQTLRYVERVANTPCTGGTEEQLPVQFDYTAWIPAAELAVRMSNLFTRLHMHNMTLDDDQLYAYFASNIDGGLNRIAGSWACYELSVNPNHATFCPAAHQKTDFIFAQDVALNYDYLLPDNPFYAPSKNHTWTNITFSRVLLKPRPDTFINLTQPVVTLANGSWSLPYYDCGGGYIWMVSYSLPFFTVTNGQVGFQGVVGVDIDLTAMDINQCDEESSSVSPSTNLFLGSHHCHAATTRCHFTPGRGFRRGNYECRCKEGFYFPNETDPLQAYDGHILEDYFDGWNRTENPFQCLPCAEGCRTCVDLSPCMVSRDWLIRSIMLAASGLCVLALIAFVLIICVLRNQPPVRAGSPLFLCIMCAGGILMQVKVIVRFPVPSLPTCTAAHWLELVGFSLLFGALLLKTWRIVCLVTVKSARPVAILDHQLLQRLVPIVLSAAVFLAAWTATATDELQLRVTRSDLKFYDCTTSWWLLAAHCAEAVLLFWGAFLCFKVRKAPSAFNESKYITWAIYNAVLIGNFLLVVMYFFVPQEGPDFVYILELARMVVIVIGSVVIILAPKLYAIKHPPKAPSMLHAAKTATTLTLQTEQPVNRKDETTQTDMVFTNILGSLTKTGPRSHRQGDGFRKVAIDAISSANGKVPPSFTSDVTGISGVWMGPLVSETPGDACLENDKTQANALLSVPGSR